MKPFASTAGRRGGPLLMLALLLTVWTGARAMWWENPFARIGVILTMPMPDPPNLLSAAAPRVTAPLNERSAFALPAVPATLPPRLADDWPGPTRGDRAD